ncbi:MAG: hypothetical protein JJT82_06610 [Legionellaceae bacterium]|nr:hypothetical protein [Legionellaceae bacterium]
MLISIRKESDNGDETTLYENLIEVKQDEGVFWLHDNQQGLCSAGHSCCYTTIIKNDQDSAILHSSSWENDTAAMINEAYETLKAQFPDQAITFIVARSENGYQNQWEVDTEEYAKIGERNTMPLAEEYFKEHDKVYKEFFVNKYDIQIEITDMTHGLLVIDSNNQLQLFEDIDVDKLGVDPGDSDEEYPPYFPIADGGVDLGDSDEELTEDSDGEYSRSFSM